MISLRNQSCSSCSCHCSVSRIHSKAHNKLEKNCSIRQKDNAVHDVEGNMVSTSSN
jgi:hypothetical protein